MNIWTAHFKLFTHIKNTLLSVYPPEFQALGTIREQLCLCSLLEQKQPTNWKRNPVFLNIRNLMNHLPDSCRNLECNLHTTDGRCYLFQGVNAAFDRHWDHKNMYNFADALHHHPCYQWGNINSNCWKKGSEINVFDCNTNYRVYGSWQSWLQKQ